MNEHTLTHVLHTNGYLSIHFPRNCASSYNDQNSVIFVSINYLADRYQSIFDRDFNKHKQESFLWVLDVSRIPCWTFCDISLVSSHVELSPDFVVMTLTSFQRMWQCCSFFLIFFFRIDSNLSLPSVFLNSRVSLSDTYFGVWLLFVDGFDEWLVSLYESHVINDTNWGGDVF